MYNHVMNYYSNDDVMESFTIPLQQLKPIW